MMNSESTYSLSVKTNACGLMLEIPFSKYTAKFTHEHKDWEQYE